MGFDSHMKLFFELQGSAHNTHLLAVAEGLEPALDDEAEEGDDATQDTRGEHHRGNLEVVASLVHAPAPEGALAWRRRGRDAAGKYA